MAEWVPIHVATHDWAFYNPIITHVPQRTPIMDIICSRIQLKPGSIERVREWAATLNSRKEEVLETLRNEGIYFECAFLDQREDGDWLVYIIKAEDMAKGWEVFQNSTLPLDEYHKKFMAEVALKRENLEALIQFDRHDEVYGWD